MAYFIGNIIPAAYARLVRFFTAKPEYMTFAQGSEIYPILARSADLMDNGTEDASTSYVERPLTGVDGTITFSAFDMIEGGQQTATISPEKVPDNSDVTPTYTYSSSAPLVASVAAGGVVTAVAAGSATITLGIQGTAFTKTFAITVVDTTVTGVDGTMDPEDGILDLSDVETATITPATLPEIAIQEQTYTYVSSAPLVASVAAGGVVTAVAAGLATITLGIQGTAFTKTFDIEVVE